MKKLLLIVGALMLLSLNVFATDTRVLTMGDNNKVLLDEHNIFLFPSRINDYPNLAIAEFSRYGSGSEDNFTKDDASLLSILATIAASALDYAASVEAEEQV